jgi:uncharacterized protein (DUF697 family)
MAQKPGASGTAEKGETGALTNSTTSKSGDITHERRHEFASQLVDRFAMWSGAAGFIPVPVVDVLAVGGLQLQMLRRLSQIYDVKFSENRGKAFIASLVGTTVPTSSAIGAGTVLKAVPLVGTAISFFVMPALSAGATYAVGKVFIQHFESGGTLLDFHPPDYREFIKAQKEMWDKRSGKNEQSDSSRAPANHS